MDVLIGSQAFNPLFLLVDGTEPMIGTTALLWLVLCINVIIFSSRAPYDFKHRPQVM